VGKFIFDGPTLTIEGNPSNVAGGIFQFDAVEIYSEWVDWIATSDNLKYKTAFSTVGGDPLGGGTYLGKFIFIRNDLGWRFKPPNTGDIKIIITGNFYPFDDNISVYSPYPGVFTSIQSRVSQLTQMVSVTTPIIEQANPAIIADEILNSQIGTSRPTGSLGEFLAKKVLTIAKFIGLK